MRLRPLPADAQAQGAYTPIWTHEPFRRDSFPEAVAERSHTPCGITTRIDSDDAMAVDFMAAVQGQFAGQQRLFVNFPRRIQIDHTGALSQRRPVQPVPVLD